MPRSILLLLVFWLPLAAPGDPVPAPEARLAALAERIGRIALPGWTVQREKDTIRLTGNVTTRPPSAPTASYVEHHTYSIIVTCGPYLDDAAQQAKLAAIQQRERKLWRAVASLECDGKEFSDHYVDGLCFRTKGQGQARRVAEYRRAQSELLDVPRFHYGRDLAVSVRVHGPEPTDGPCDSCATMETAITDLLIPYPAAP